MNADVDQLTGVNHVDNLLGVVPIWQGNSGKTYLPFVVQVNREVTPVTTLLLDKPVTSLHSTAPFCQKARVHIQITAP